MAQCNIYLWDDDGCVLMLMLCAVIELERKVSARHNATYTYGEGGGGRYDVGDDDGVLLEWYLGMSTMDSNSWIFELFSTK